MEWWCSGGGDTSLRHHFLAQDSSLRRGERRGGSLFPPRTFFAGAEKGRNNLICLFVPLRSFFSLGGVSLLVSAAFLNAFSFLLPLRVMGAVTPVRFEGVLAEAMAKDGGPNESLLLLLYQYI